MLSRKSKISVRHASPAIEARVREWFSGKVTKKQLDGERSIRIPHPEKEGHWLKIKGAGLRGGPIQFGRQWKTGPKAPVFDFDGRMMEDVASGHDNSYAGGASFQQAAVEYRMTRKLQDLGMETVPCAGYGRITKAGRTSWFSLFELDRGWKSLVLPIFPLQEYVEAHVTMGRLMVDLAIHHGLVGHCWYLRTPQGRHLLKDLHPFRTVDSISMSQISWVMQLFYALHLLGLAVGTLAPKAGVDGLPEDIQVFPFRGMLPDARLSEHEDLRRSLVVPYMLKPPKSFDSSKLLRTLRANRITSTLMELCPEEYARPEF